MYLFPKQSTHNKLYGHIDDPSTALIRKGLSTGRKIDTDNMPITKAYNYWVSNMDEATVSTEHVQTNDKW